MKVLFGQVMAVPSMQILQMSNDGKWRQVVLLQDVDVRAAVDGVFTYSWNTV